MQTHSLTRRARLRTGAAGGASMAAARLQRNAAVQGQGTADMPPAVMTDGYAGGGTVPTPTGDAQFSLAVFAREPADGTSATITGSFQLEDLSDPANPVTMTSDELTSYTAFSTSLPNARQVTGWAKVNGSGPYLFLLRVEDTAGVGDAANTLNLVFGEAALPFLPGDGSKACDCGGFTYSLRGTVATGDLMRFEIG